jgi:putative ABC transport system permease protein
MALGADRRRVSRMILREALVLLAIGLAAGCALALPAARAAASQLYGLRAWDPATFAAAVGLLALVALVASAVPARRAARVDPMEVLRDA